MAKKEIYSNPFYFPMVKQNFDYENVKQNNVIFLLDLCTSIFKWTFENMTEKESKILSSEIEKILMLSGVCTLYDVGKEEIDIKAFFCNENTPTYYYDVFANRTINSPL